MRIEPSPYLLARRAEGARIRRQNAYLRLRDLVARRVADGMARAIEAHFGQRPEPKPEVVQ